jgi:hypothetical protein
MEKRFSDSTVYREVEEKDKEIFLSIHMKRIENSEFRDGSIYS